MTILREACDQLDDGPDYRCQDYIENLLNTALDFRMLSKTVDKAINHFKTTHKVKTHEELKSLLASFPDTKDGNEKLAECLWNYKFGSRAKFLRKIVDFFESNGVRDQATLDCWAKSADFDADVKGLLRTEHHSIGYTLFQWLRVRCGANTLKPDSRVLNFIRNVIGRTVTPVEAVRSLEAIAKESNRRANRLDAAIWHFMDGKSLKSFD